jgi:predicted PurR-regulated permease PerM
MLFGVGSAIFTAFLAFVSSVYILFEKEAFKAFLCRLIKAAASTPAYETTLKYSRMLNHNFKQYIYTQTIDGLILGTVVTIELYLIGSEYFLLLGVMLGILNYIPYFGSIVGSLIAVCVVMLTQGLPLGMVTAVVLLITQQLDGNVLQPKLMGGSFRLSPLLVIISITIGGAFAGALGMIAAIPIVAVLKDVLENMVLHHEQKKHE